MMPLRSLDAAKAAAPFAHARMGQVEPKVADPDFVPLSERIKEYDREDAIERSAGDVAIRVARNGSTPSRERRRGIVKNER
jgi:hypothetical protein